MKKKQIQLKPLGCLEINGIGGFQEKFFTYLFNKSIKLCNIEQINGGFSAYIRPYNYLIVKRAAKKFGVLINIEKKSGLYFILKKYENRLGIILGFFLFGLVTTGLSTHLWDIEIIGNDKIPDSAFFSILNECGIEIGQSINEINYDMAQQSIMLKIDNIGWVGIEQSGCRLNVKINEKTKKPEMVETSQPCNVVASRDGKIILAEVYSGTFLTQEGSGINKGGMIVSGIVEDKSGNILYEHASAKIIAEFKETVDFFVSYESIEKIPNGEKTVNNYLKIMNTTIPLFWGDGVVSDAKYTEDIYNQYFFGVELPYKIKTGTYTKYTGVVVKRSNDQIISELREQKSTYEQNFFKNYDIIECREAYSTDENGIHLSIYYKLKGDIAKQEKIELNFIKEPNIS